jgi:apolipoprotein N-acyltransferase
MPRLRVKLSTRARVPVLLLSGIVLSFSFPAADLGPLAWIGLVPLLLLLHTQSIRAGFLLGMIFGLGFFGALLIWISLVGWVAWTVLVILQAAFIGIFGLLYASAGRMFTGGRLILVAPVLWTAVEYLRSLVPVGGFSWGQLAQSQHDLGWMLRPAAIGGGWLTTFLIVAVNAGIAFWMVEFSGESRRRGLVGLGCACALIAGPLLLPPESADGEEVSVAIVQGNVPRNWTGTSFEKDVAILQSHVRLTQELNADDVDFIVWPESSVGIDPEAIPEVGDQLSIAARAAGAPLVVGGNSDAGEDHYRVMAFQVSRDGEIVDRYQKTHLVPFGEYVPARKLLEWIPMLDQVPRDAIAADEPRLFHLASGLVAPVLSYEGDFGSLVRDRIDHGGRLLLVITNTSTWGDSWASTQHVAFSQLRAAENGVWVVHAAISGISAFIAPDGSVTQASELWTKATLVQDMQFADGISFYARTGDWVPIGCAAATVAVILVAAIRAQRASGARVAGE